METLDDHLWISLHVRILMAGLHFVPKPLHPKCHQTSTSDDTGLYLTKFYSVDPLKLKGLLVGPFILVGLLYGIQPIGSCFILIHTSCWHHLAHYCLHQCSQMWLSYHRPWPLAKVGWGWWELQSLNTRRSKVEKHWLAIALRGFRKGMLPDLPGDVGNWSWDLLHGKQVLYLKATALPQSK